LSPRCALETDNHLNSLTFTTVTTNCPLHFVHAKENRIVDSTDNRFNRCSDRFWIERPLQPPLFEDHWFGFLNRQ